MANQDKTRPEKDASGHEQPGSREPRSDREFPKQRGTDQFGTHGGPGKREKPAPAANEAEDLNKG